MNWNVLLPFSLVADAPSLKLKTLKIGLVGRALAIFRIKKVVVYRDDEPKLEDQGTDGNLIATLLEYMETPQYLRRFLFKRVNELRYAGILPPLRTPHHPLRHERSSPGELREGAVISSSSRGSVVELGLKEKGIVRRRLRVGQRVTVRLGNKSKGFIKVDLASPSPAEGYWGYKVELSDSLAEAVQRLKPDYAIATSRRGGDFESALEQIQRRGAKAVAIAFGGPYSGIFEICKRQGVQAEELFDAIVNTIPNQGTKTVRTEEALIATLALFNALVR